MKFRWVSTLFSTAVILATTGAATAQMRKPQSRDEVLETLVRGENVLALPPALRKDRVVLRQNPKDLSVAKSFALEILPLARRTADPRFYGEIEAALQPWWKKQTTDRDVLFLRATVKQFNHDFEDALSDLKTLLGVVPGDVSARLLEATILQVTDKHKEALQSCSLLLVGRDTTIRTICTSLSHATLSDPEPIYGLLKISLGLTLDMPPPKSPTELYAITVAAAIATQVNRIAEAVAWHEKIVIADPSDSYARASLADLFLDNGRPEEAARLTCSFPDQDSLLLRCARARKILADPTFAELRTILTERSEAEKLRGSGAHMRERAYLQIFILDNSKDGLVSALENWKRQREPIDARLLFEASVRARDKVWQSEIAEWTRQHHILYEPFVKLLKQSEEQTP